MKQGKGNLGGRLKGEPLESIVEHVYKTWLEHDRQGFPYLNKINKAHVVMLGENSIIQPDVVCKLLEILNEIEEGGLKVLKQDASREGLYYNYEQFIMEKLGAEIGGQIHTGRSRNDIGSTLNRMLLRDEINGLFKDLFFLRTSLLQKAKGNIDTIMPGYTHSQPAQPITFAHYLTAIDGALRRDCERLFSAYSRINKCPMGACALAGTGWSISRERVAELLGFDGLIVNTIDAVASRDHVLEALSICASIETTLSRLSQDLYTWCTYEFSLIEFPDSLGGSSSIMPQKKNPYVLEVTKAKAAHVYGALVSALASMKNTPFTNVIDVSRESLHYFADAIKETKATLKLLGDIIKEIDIDREKALQKCKENFSTVTDLADALVGKCSLSFREAHTIIGGVVREAMEKGLTSDMITADILENVARKTVGKEVRLMNEDIVEALDPREAIARRRLTGGPAPEQTRGIIEAGLLDIKQKTHQVEEQERMLNDADWKLREAVWKSTQAGFTQLKDINSKGLDLKKK